MATHRNKAAAHGNQVSTPSTRMSKSNREKSVPDFVANSRGAVVESVGLDVRMMLWSPILLTALVLVCLTPFLGKAFHIDDPLFIWAGKQIAQHPGNPYGFTVNWYTAPQQIPT